MASVRARSRDLRAGPDQPQLQRARQNEPRSIVVALCPAGGPGEGVSGRDADSGSAGDSVWAGVIRTGVRGAAVVRAAVGESSCTRPRYWPQGPVA